MPFFQPFVRALAGIRNFLVRCLQGLLAPRVVLVGVVAVATATSLYYGSQRWMVSRLAAQLETVDDARAPGLVRELARFERRAYATLVRATHSPRSSVALSARRQIDLCVEAWEHESFLHPATFDLSTTAIPLADAFALQAQEMSPSAAAWSRAVLEKLAALAQSQPLRQKMQLLASCDEALAALPKGDLRTALADADRANYDLMLGSVLRPRRSAEPPTPQAGVAENNLPPSRPTPRLAAAAPRRRADEQWRSTLPEPGEEAPRSSPRPAVGDPSPEGAASRTPPPPRPSNPAILPHPRPTPDAAPAALPEGTARGATRKTRGQGDRSLFEALSEGSPEVQVGAAEQLYALGYGQVGPRDARLLLSPSIDDRQALVESVLTSRRLEAGKWLRMLLHDPAPQVRATVVKGISTTDNEALLREALDVAVRDTDPRVADQAERLRDRLR